VQAELRLKEMEISPPEPEYHFGNDIRYRFKIEDGLSRSLVVGGRRTHANAYLVISREAEVGFPEVMVRVPASDLYDSKGVHDGYEVVWSINPNAASGNAIVSLEVTDSAGRRRPLFQAGPKLVRYKQTVSIGGSIDIDSTARSTPSSSSQPALFTVQVKLSCKGKPLKGATLLAQVYYSAGGQDFECLMGDCSLSFPVVADTATYQVSWRLPNADAPPGEYQVRFIRADEMREASNKKDIKRTRGLNFTAEDEPKELFQVALHRTGESVLDFKVPMEFVVTAALGLAWVYLSNKKHEILEDTIIVMQRHPERF